MTPLNKDILSNQAKIEFSDLHTNGERAVNQTMHIYK